MSLPDDFGLTPLQTLARVADPTPPGGFVQFWTRWADAVWSKPAKFEAFRLDRDASLGQPGAPGVTHTIVAHDGVRCGCRVILPVRAPGQIRGVVITAHGYTLQPYEPLTDDNPWSGGDRPIAVVKVRVRGYPGSHFSTGDLSLKPGGYIVQGIEKAESWVLAGAASDYAAAIRAARDMFGQAVPIMLHGESFGAAIAIIAASGIGSRERFPRLAIGLPTLGDWTWRLRRLDAINKPGIGHEVVRYLRQNASQTAAVTSTLRLFDTVVHARRITSPVVCKLAERDEVVPAPTAAAVYNAFGADPGRKWRFVTRFGHCSPESAGADSAEVFADLRRHAQFEKLIGDFLDATRDIGDVMKQWEQSCA